ncbi:MULTISPECIES: LuxR C-terminal-related transcriptional regulator [unclassified Kribbella]|uniref:LuxR C-terminal-related transcriptional regulator n=1 Tax=unclassified Kribbella TaxID=2644121 RepID=UPI0033D911F7
MAAELIAEGRAALRRGDAVSARAALEQAGRGPEVLEVLASASFVLLEYDRSLHEMETAYAGYRAAGDGAGAARVARMLGGMHGSTSGDWAVASGWIARAKTLLSDLPDSNERGWVALTEGMFDGDRARKNADFRLAVEIGRRTEDADLTFAALAYLGASLVHDDRTEEGMLLLDEACAAVAGAEVDSFLVVEEIFCQLFSACEHAHDVTRADQWIRIGEQVAERRRLPAVSAYCHTHYGGILTAAGRWPEADAALTAAVRLWALGRRTLKAGALARLADLRVRQGRYDEAAALLDGLTDDDSVQPRAALHLARGEYAVALDLLEHAAHRADPRTSSCLPLLALLADAQLAAGQDPQPTIEAMAACADLHPSPYANALVALAHGRAGHGDPKRWLRDALDGFNRSQLPLEASLCRLDLARACSHDNPEVAIAEARNALRSFEMLEAARYVDAATAVLRQLGQKVRPPAPSGNPLSRREEDVLRLLGAGLSNPQIAERLFISRKTVEHHVGNILVKLGLRNRAEAAAYAVRREPAAK